MDAPTLRSLLGRPPLPLPPLPPNAFAERSVLVTGAGGSIGSALCRRLARLPLRRLILVEQAEGALERVERRLREVSRVAPFVPVLGNAGDVALLRELLARHRPDTIFHAAAFKHLPLLEAQVLAAVENNVLVTRRLVSVAAAAGVERCVLLSSDKAVNPVGVLGATKRLAELMALAEPIAPTRFSALRLSNVLGSSGSVLPRLEAQVRRGLPLRLSDPEASRYFVSRSEAVRCLFHVAEMGQGGELFLPDPGAPVPIPELARRLLRASGADSPLLFEGLRPGEKRSEELWSADEARLTTGVPALLRLAGPVVRRGELEAALGRLEATLLSRDAEAVRAALAEIVQNLGRARPREAAHGSNRRR